MTTASALGVSELLARLAAELLTLQTMTAEIEDAVSSLQLAGLGAERIKTLQHLDLLNQSLHALARACSSASGLAGAGWTIDGLEATRGLPLAALALRLRGQGAAATPAEHGDELFTGD